MVGRKSPRKNTPGTGPTRGKRLPATARPRRFSLIYSSDSSSLSDVSDGDGHNNRPHSNKNKMKRRGADNVINNSTGKQSKLIQESNENALSSDYEAIDDDRTDTSSDDDDDDSDSDSDSSSDDENIDFVKLTAQRKKRAMKALSAIKRGQTNNGNNKDNNNENNNNNNNEVVPEGSRTNKDLSPKKEEEEESNASVEEDIGEEIVESRKSTPSKNLSDVSKTLNKLHVPEFSEDSEESEYDIDHDAYFSIINDGNNSVGEIDTGLETGDDDLPVLEEEEHNIVSELQNDDNLSIDDSAQDESTDLMEHNKPTNQYDNEEDDEDEIMTDFDLPFYEDPKFSNLYYYQEENEPRLNLNSTSLPLILNDERRIRIQEKEARRRERKERIEARKMLRKNAKSKPGLDGDEYVFGVFFHSDNEDEQDKDKTKTEGTRIYTVQNSDSSDSDDDYDNILLDVAQLPSDDEELMAIDSDDNDDSSEFDMSAESDDFDELDDDSSATNIFIDIDDLDPDSFYFRYSDDEISNFSDKTPSKDSEDASNGALETLVYVDDESTDEDDNLPPPNLRKRNVGTKAKEIVSANVVGLRPPKLGTWETNNKPFSIIDGLSTKSLYALIHEHQQLQERSQSPELAEPPSTEQQSGEDMTLNELLNMSELEEGEGEDTPSHQTLSVSDWYNKPKVPLSAFRNKGVSIYDDDEYLTPSLSVKKVPIGYVGGERTRKKIDKMKELQRKRTEKKRTLKKKRKLLKLRRKRARMEKEKLSTTSDPTGNDDLHEGPTDTTVNESKSLSHSELPDFDEGLSDHIYDTENMGSSQRKDSLKSVGIDEIHEILGKDDSSLLDNHHSQLMLHNDLAHDKHQDENAIAGADADILASLTAPVDFDDFENTSSSLWKQRRHSMAEAAAENLRFTKNGLFSEAALANLESIIDNEGPSDTFEFNEVLQ
ncbi:hypothetical protein KAFR_0H01760 [Kazachstania africana CBS 2517]|uniref:Protein IFH1 n=1 Tax=Kazachstania africana (strain ATCC 22294 / BCRC 22015 / CBS 2517 / CECT 1963 / NBRC 1671 / NRRL Y-8276) TaxID=1071382 RepID=H2AZ30_KAZAF|nr:hypothetical protein KAFR_0H01760 [Kazachstania africana CBS 2517]CCF59586.1 hypothetical protein KAFR_0H01760 [Kazachstania africana CBS 2517]